MPMAPTKTIPIARDPKSLRLEADEAQMVRMAELQDHMFYNRLVKGMRERQSQSTNVPKNKLEDECQGSFVDKLPNTTSVSSALPVSIVMALSQSNRSNRHESQSTSSLVSASPSNSVLSLSPHMVMPHPPTTVVGQHMQRAELCSVLTHSIQILDDAPEEEELMFEMDF